MPSQCEINFDHFNALYYSGQSLNGAIQLTTHAPKTIRGVHITVNGYAKVKWKKKSGRNTTTYHALDKYLESRTYVAGQMNGVSFEFAPGIYDYTFCCELPFSLPSSVSGKYGEIKYEVIVTIDRPFRFDNVFKREFTVIRELNLNIFPIFWKPKEGIVENEVCAGCYCGKPGIIRTNLKIPVSAYAPGQKINFVLEVGNESTNDLEECKVKFKKCITFESRQPYVRQKNDYTTLDRKYFPQVLRNSNKIFEDGIIIPLVPPSSSTEDGIIRVSYELHATIKTGFFHKNINFIVPITIGTTPLTMSTTNQTEVNESNSIQSK